MYGRVLDHGLQCYLHPQQLRGQLVRAEGYRGIAGQRSDSRRDIRSCSNTEEQENRISEH